MVILSDRSSETRTQDVILGNETLLFVDGLGERSVDEISINLHYKTVAFEKH